MDRDLVYYVVTYYSAVVNHCPRCGGLTRTPKAKLCLHCGHSWHREAAG